MMTEHQYRYEGRRRVLLNLHPDGPGGPHDDNVARMLGFRRALVPGEAVAEAVMPAIVARFGTRFMEGGWLSLKMIAPTHVDEEVFEIGESVEGSPDLLDLRLETSEGRLTCVGRAGLGGIDSGTPWCAEEDGTRDADIAHPGLTLGKEFPDLWFIHDKAEVAVCRDAGGDETPWFRGPSPWGGPVSPPLVLIATQLHVNRRLPAGTGTAAQPATLSELFASFQAKNAELEARRLMGMSEDGAKFSELDSGEGLAGVQFQHDIVVERPMFQEMPYVMSSRLVDKGVARSGRSWFSTTQFEVRDSAGILYATGRATRRTLLVERSE